MPQSIERISAVLEIIAHQTGIGNRLKEELVQAKMKEIADREERLNPKPSEEELGKQEQEAERLAEIAKRDEESRLKELIAEGIAAHFAKEKEEAAAKKAEKKAKKG